ncbi:MAG: peptidylprolyl isomerase [Treponema sp.]|jgi:parvulin-like peptidyl-prolyl isomerase|nr:peptidylprolyl isomerase [Treponema sp.]
MKRTLLFVILCSLTAVCGFSQADLQPAAIVKLTKSEPITVKQLRTEVERMEKGTGRALNQAERLQVLDVIINERLAIQAAERDRITISENEVNQQIQQLRNVLAQQLGRQPTEAEFNQAVRNESGMDLQSFRDQLRRQLIVQKYLMSKKESIINSAKAPTNEEILSQYNLFKTQFVRPETVRFSMIQVPYGPDAASRVKAKELADRLFREIGSNPSRFDEVASRSQAPNSGYQAGDGGFLPRNPEAQSVVGTEFINTAFSMKQGEVSKLIEGIQGFQIIKITENYDMKNLELDDIVQLGTRVTVREYIAQALMNERQQAVLAKASQELITELRAGNTFQVFNQNLNW